MKETMETLKCKAVHVAAGAAQTARLVALISKKKFAILAEQDKIRRCYTQLGKVYYKDYVTDEEPDDAEYDPLCERISQSFRRINRLRQELEAAKAKLAGEQPEDEAEPEAKPENNSNNRIEYRIPYTSNQEHCSHHSSRQAKYIRIEYHQISPEQLPKHRGSHISETITYFFREFYHSSTYFLIFIILSISGSYQSVFSTFLLMQ